MGMEDKIVTDVPPARQILRHTPIIKAALTYNTSPLFTKRQQQVELNCRRTPRT
jgi:hypothetical protein